MKKTGITLAVLAVVIIAGIFIFQLNASQADTLSSDEIRSIVMDQYPGEVRELALDSNTETYKVKVQTENKTYQLSVDSQSGEVLALNEIDLTDNSTAQQEETAEQETPPKNEKEAQKNNNQTKNNEKESIRNNNSSDQALLSHEKIKEIALNEFSGTIIEMELDEDDGRLVYEVEIENNEDEATMEIDAYTGQVIIVEIDLED